jgi:hypothetical protein
MINYSKTKLWSHQQICECLIHSWDFEMTDISICGRTTMMKTGNRSSIAPWARLDQGCLHASALCPGGGGHGGLSRRAHGVTAVPARARPWSPPTGELRCSISLPQVPKKTSSTNLKIMTWYHQSHLVTKNVTLTSFGVRKRRHDHGYELVKDILVGKPQSFEGSF